MTRRLRLSLLIFVVGVAFGPVLLVSLIRTDMGFYRLRDSGDKVPAVVVRVIDARNHPNRRFEIEYKYQGHPYTGKIKCTRHFQCPAGSGLLLYVDPTDPTHFITDRGQTPSTPADLLWIPALVLCVAVPISGGYAIKEHLRIRRDAARYAQHPDHAPR